MTGKSKEFLGPVGVLSGGIIGAGVFSLPYVFHQSGLLAGAVLLVLGTIAYSYLHLMYADVVAGTPTPHRFVGFISSYLGREWSLVAIIVAVLEMLLILTVYLVLAGSFLRLVSPQLDVMTAIAVFWFFGVVTMFARLKQLALVEALITGAIVVIIVILFCFSAPGLAGAMRHPVGGTQDVLWPLAAIFFALSGRAAIPIVVNRFRLPAGVERHAVRRAVVWGTIMPAFLYGLFILAVLSVSGVVSKDGVSGMVGAIPDWLSMLVGIFGVLALWSSYVVIGRDVNDTLRFDLDLPHWLRLFIVVVVPPLLYIMGFDDFVRLVSFIGGIFLALEGAFIVLVWRAARQRHALAGLVHVSRFILLFLWALFAAALIGVLTSGL